jgi:hypothetical protein
MSPQPADTLRHAENQNEFSPSYIAQLGYDIANPQSHSEICGEIRQGILKQSLPTERSELMWKHSIAIGRISPAINESLFNALCPSASLDALTITPSSPRLSMPISALAQPLPGTGPGSQETRTPSVGQLSPIIQAPAARSLSPPPPPDPEKGYR